ncbi:inactive phospholipid phosphatase 7 [Pimephales promelas]|uniref:inactive phospholipid phosphatase 7 n=1 Tax=Pimephales promelas TaxID=90988 RepID=UPI001955F2E5|nr:inactive phospholipid phosphatase 7 [Pimephales promelas]KAG1957674.1 inactive phospholipid phosphatase [Pimephales promelas]
MPANPSRSRAKDRGISTSVLGRPEFLSLNSPPRNHSRAWRRSGQNQASENTHTHTPADEDRMLLNPSLRGIAVSSLLAVDICLSKRLSVCVQAGSPWASVRSGVTLLALTGHGVTWVCGTLVCLSQSHSPAGQELLINLLIALLLDLLTVAGVQKLVRRRGPWHSSPDSFPAGQASRAALVSRFLLSHLDLAVPLRVLLVLWAGLAGLSRVLLGQNHLSDVSCGFALGFLHSGLMEAVWVPSGACQTLLSIGTFSWASAR